MGSAGIRILRLSQIGLDDASSCESWTEAERGCGTCALAAFCIRNFACLGAKDFEQFSLNPKRTVDWLVPTSDMIRWMSWFKERCSVSARDLQRGIKAGHSFRKLCHWFEVPSSQALAIGSI